MIQAGKNIAATGDELQKIKVEYLFHAIRNPNIEIQNKIRQLRIVRNIDVKQYAYLKRRLPYFVCGQFNPNIRRTENFAYTSYFIVDIDHLSDKGINLGELRGKLEADNRVVLSFISPSEDGLKLMFKLSERCYDAGIYSVFYKQFIADFSKQYGLEQVTDSRTSDVTRACFISFDPNVYYNAEADSISLNAFVDINNPYEMFSEKKRLEKEEAEKERENIEKIIPKADVDSEVINKIKSILHNAPKPIEKPPAYIPEQLNEIIDDLKAFIISTGTVVQDIINISYGKKIKVSVGQKMGEVNLFYGSKRGFTVVISPRTGTTPEINEMIANLVESFLLTHII